MTAPNRSSGSGAVQHAWLAAPPLARGRVGRYALWQLRDFAMNRGLPILIIGALFVLQIRTLGRRLAGIAPETLLGLVSNVLGPFVLIASLIAINGIISNDRRQGYHRFLFAKPVSIPRYYLQAFVLHGLGLVAAAALFLLALWWATGVRIPAEALLYPAVYYVLLGGIGFLFSSLLRNDWIPIATVVAASALANLNWGDDAGLRGWAVRWVLPPFRLFEELREVLLRGAMPEPWPTVWPVIYGLVAVGAGVIVLRRKAMG